MRRRVYSFSNHRFISLLLVYLVIRQRWQGAGDELVSLDSARCAAETNVGFNHEISPPFKI